MRSSWSGWGTDATPATRGASNRCAVLLTISTAMSCDYFTNCKQQGKTSGCGRGREEKIRRACGFVVGGFVDGRSPHHGLFKLIACSVTFIGVPSAGGAGAIGGAVDSIGDQGLPGNLAQQVGLAGDLWAQHAGLGRIDKHARQGACAARRAAANLRMQHTLLVEWHSTKVPMWPSQAPQ